VPADRTDSLPIGLIPFHVLPSIISGHVIPLRNNVVTLILWEQPGSTSLAMLYLGIVLGDCSVGCYLQLGAAK
jgi:hypothetical protein